MNRPVASLQRSRDLRRRAALLRWFRNHRRDLPWRRGRTPYRTWVAEVLLQQTRVAHATRYFERFVRRFPTIDSLAAARLSEVLKLWEGAGYYARARNLHRAARELVRRFQGRLPHDPRTLRALPGFGPYLANAVSSQAFGWPALAVDANVLRVAARWFAERHPISSARVRRRLAARIETVLPSTGAAVFNEAIMELGETVCRPRRPLCPSCPVSVWCDALQRFPDPGILPARRTPSARPHIVAAVAAIEANGRWLVQRRPLDGLLGGLWEFPGGKVRPGEQPEEAARREIAEETGLRPRTLEKVGVLRHAYTHFTVDLHLFRGRVTASKTPRASGRRWLTLPAFARLPRPAATVKLSRWLESAVDTVSPDSESRRGRTFV